MWKNLGRSVISRKKQEKTNIVPAVPAATNKGNGVNIAFGGTWEVGNEYYGPDVSEITYFTVLRILSESVAKIPVHCINGNNEIVTNKANDVVSMHPNTNDTANKVFGYLEFCRNHYGNAYAYVKWNSKTGELESMIPLNPNAVRIYINDLSDDIDIQYYYTYTTIAGKTFLMLPEDMIHLRSWHLDDATRLVGQSVKATLHEYMQAAKAGQKTQNDLYKNGMIASAVVNYAGDLDEKSKQMLIDNMRKIGKENKIIPFPQDWKITPINLSLSDNQYLETRKYTGAQIAAAFGVNPVQINDYSRGSYSNASSQQLAFLTETMMYIGRQYEDELTAKLLTEQQIADGLRIKLDTDAILRMSPENLAKTLYTCVSGGFMRINEARIRAGMPAVADGDRFIKMPGAELFGKEDGETSENQS